MRKILVTAVSTAVFIPVGAAAFDIFAPPESVRADPIFPTQLALGDVDGDGMLDLVVATNAENLLLLNNGKGKFKAPKNITDDSHDSRVIALADIDGENGLDVVVGNTAFGGIGMEVNRYYLNTGSSPWFTGGSDVGSDVDATVSLAVGDLDGVNGQDIVTGNIGGAQGSPNRAYLNTGAGYSASMVVRSGAGADIALADLNGDGLDDYLEIEGSVFALLNDGNGQLNVPFGDGFFPSAPSGAAIAAGDLDGDGDPDVVVAASDPASRSLVHISSGSSLGAGTSLSNPLDLSSRDVALADLNGDGHLDIVETNSGGADAVYLNDGMARFDHAANITDTPTFSAIKLGDVDNDGDVDLIAGNKLFRNVSSTRFAALGDVNGNSSPDFATLRRDTKTNKNVLDIMDSESGEVIVTTTVQRDAIRGLGVIADISADDVPEVVVLTEGSVRAHVMDATTGAKIKTMRFSNKLIPRQVLTLPDIDENGADEIAVFGTNTNNPLVWTQIKDSMDDVEISRVKFGKKLRYLHALVLDDINGNDVSEIAFFGLAKNHRVVVTVKDSLTSDKVTVFKATRANEFPLGYAAVPDADGRLTYVAVLVRASNGKIKVIVRDAEADGSLVAKLGFSSQLDPLGLLVMSDTDGDTSPGQVSPEIAVLGRNAGGSVKLQMIDLASGVKIGPNLQYASSWQPVRLLELGEAGQGPALDVAVLGINSNGAYRAEIVDPISTTTVAKIKLP